MRSSGPAGLRRKDGINDCIGTQGEIAIAVRWSDGRQLAKLAHTVTDGRGPLANCLASGWPVGYAFCLGEQ